MKLPAKVKLNESNPPLYLSLTTFGVIGIALGLNFFVFVPTFEQFDIPKNLIGAGFMTLGLAFLFFLNVYRNLNVLRVILIVNTAYCMIWGVGSTQTVFEGTSSAQLFVLYWGLAGLQIPLLLTPFIGPSK